MAKFKDDPGLVDYANKPGSLLAMNGLTGMERSGILDETCTFGKEALIFVNQHVQQLLSAHRLGRFTNIVSAVYPPSYGGTALAAFSESTGFELDNDGKANRVDTVVFEGQETGMATRALVGVSEKREWFSEVPMSTPNPSTRVGWGLKPLDATSDHSNVVAFTRKNRNVLEYVVGLMETKDVDMSTFKPIADRYQVVANAKKELATTEENNKARVGNCSKMRKGRMCDLEGRSSSV